MKANQETDRLGAAIALAIAKIDNRLQALERIACEPRIEWKKLEKFLIEALPDRATELVFDEPGHIISRQGDGILIEKCEAISKYKIIATRQTRSNGTTTCYTNLPVRVDKRKAIMFLDIPSRRLHTTGITRDCETTPPVLLVKQPSQRWIKLTRRGVWQNTTISHKITNTRISLPRLMAFNKRLTHHKEVSIPHTPLMEIIERGGPLIKTLTDIGSENVGENLRQLRDKGEEVFGGIKHNIQRARDLLFEPIKRYAYYTLGGVGLVISLYVAWRCRKCQHRQAMPPPHVIISERIEGETARLRIEESSM